MSILRLRCLSHSLLYQSERTLHERFFATVPTSSHLNREALNYDVLIVGGGPAGLSAAIKIKQLCEEKEKDISVCVVEKGGEIGSHILSGNVLETKALDELFADWRSCPDVPIKVPASKDRFYYLASSSSSFRLPAIGPLHNKGNYIVSLSEVCRWLGKRAESLGVEVLSGYSGKEVLYNWNGAVVGVTTGDHGVAKDGSRKETFSLGVELRARATLFAEGCRGSLSESLIKRYNLRESAEHQTYALGLKEVWEVPTSQHKEGTVIHTVGYPTDHGTYGGGFVYHMADNKVALGLVIGLDYKNPTLNTFKEFQRWKLHPVIRQNIEGGTCLQYGARTLNEGGLQSIPKLSFPGGALIGCSAGFLNVPKIKGTHMAMKSGILVGEAVFRALTGEAAAAAAEAETIKRRREVSLVPAPAGSDAVVPSEAWKKGPADLSELEGAVQRSWITEELHSVRNIRPAFSMLGLIPGLLHAFIETYVFRGKAPWTFSHRAPDHERTQPLSECTPISYSDFKPDAKLTLDLPRALYLSGTNHDHDQPSHLTLRDPGVPERVNHAQFGGPESKYCPAGVYEYREEANGRQHLVINAQNCLHCKACDIKDSTQNIKWTTPQGGGGPNYKVM
ncbi:hypothetical protein CEUSTIGMA_g7536.t1 [Chlamydomonas eustigma]|uniref:Electron transfer flavoprotein-ubiquinone oxidoreductase n=1 Tax=Chlamydomonas eustigma TaxID=1157962 RepID=A0A250XAJ3_9CHLO|nr:hypothetical protein CEUSTIGMA_g7536.t1 [Chlamydomonas eustigma]|eukprot:GAX80098.1 hypothetical protein CEUSTIGMA_g7536.t1 [Chlamydomonas eustigma]